MVHETNRPSPSSGGLIVAVLLLLLLGGMSIVGVGSYFWLRTESTARQAVLQERAAMEAQADAMRRQALQLQARQAAEEAPQELPSAQTIDVLPAEEADSDKVDVPIALDKDGNVSLHGQGRTHEELAAELERLEAEDGSNLIVTIWADDECPFRSVAEVVRVCRASGIDAVKLAVSARGERAAQPN